MYLGTGKLAAILSAIVIASPTISLAQDGCYFGVCPGDPGTEFPEVQTLPIPAPTPTPAPAPEPGPQTTPTSAPATLGSRCLDAFGVTGDFHWQTLLGYEDALAVCEAAMRENPNDQHIRFAYAVARDMISEQRNNPADNFYAVDAYRSLLEEGYTLAGYALATMYDEDSGVTVDEAAGLYSETISSTVPASAKCMAMVELDKPAFGEGQARPETLLAIEPLARSSPICASYLLETASGLDAIPPLPLALDEYAKFAAIHGHSRPMQRLGDYYAAGGAAYTTAKYAGRINLQQDTLRSGDWFLVAFGMAWLRNPELAEESWFEMLASSPSRSRSMQTSLKQLSLYDGAIDGDFGPRSQRAILTFVEREMTNPLFQRVRSTEPLSSVFPDATDVQIAMPLPQ